MRAILALLFFVALPARADDIEAALIEKVIRVDAGFTGAKVTLFGDLAKADVAAARNAAPLDLVAVLRGPKADFRLRPRVKRGMIWTSGPAITIGGAPGFLMTASARPLDEVAPAETLARLEIGVDPGAVAALIKVRGERSAAYVGAEGALAVAHAFVEAATSRARYGETVGAVKFEKTRLFRIELSLPPVAPIGRYRVDVYLFRDGALVDQDGAELVVDTVGVERAIFDFARRHSAVYGLFCVALSLAAGVGAALAFRK